MSERILVLMRGHVGDLVLTLPALRELRKARPSARITLFVNEYLNGAITDCPYVDDVIYGFAYEPRGRILRAIDVVRALGKLVGRFDIFLALRNSPRLAAVLGMVSGAKM